MVKYKRVEGTRRKMLQKGGQPKKQWVRRLSSIPFLQESVCTSLPTDHHHCCLSSSYLWFFLTLLVEWTFHLTNQIIRRFFLLCYPFIKQIPNPSWVPAPNLRATTANKPAVIHPKEALLCTLLLACLLRLPSSPSFHYLGFQYEDLCGFISSLHFFF